MSTCRHKTGPVQSLTNVIGHKRDTNGQFKNKQLIELGYKCFPCGLEPRNMPSEVKKGWTEGCEVKMN